MEYRRPTRPFGTAAGSTTCRTSPNRLRPSVRPASISAGSVPRIPANRFRYSGKNTPSAIRISLGSSPMPNQMISSGIRPTTGTVRSIWIGASMTSSPTLNRPAISAAISAAVRPKSSPSPTRCAEARMASCSSPVPISSPALAMTSCGGARVCGDSQPASLATYQSSSSASGLIALISARGMPSRRAPSATRDDRGGRHRRCRGRWRPTGRGAPTVRSCRMPRARAPDCPAGAPVPRCAQPCVSRQRTRPRSWSGPALKSSVQ